MKPKNSLHLAGWLLILACVALLCPALSAEAQEVHALLIILGNDAVTRDSVNKNEESLKNLLRLVSQECTVHLTVMKSVDESTGTVVTQTFPSTGAGRIQPQNQGIITATQVVQWLRDLQPNPADTVLVYYSGHGAMDALNEHILQFDPEVTNDLIARKGLRGLLEEKPARLKMLITDTCRNTTEVPKQKVALAQVQGKNRRYIKDLFLEHTGTLDIAAASPGQFAWGNNTIGGYFTAALIESCSPTLADLADRNKDGFLEWREVFSVCISETESLFTNAEFTSADRRSLDQAQQTTQKPVAHSLPARRAGSAELPKLIDDSRLDVPVEKVPQPGKTATLTITSTPSGGTVYLDGEAVGTTPLRGYKVSLGTRDRKAVRITIGREGDAVYFPRPKDLKLTQNQHTPWHFQEESLQQPRTRKPVDLDKMVLIPDGKFRMGTDRLHSKRAEPVHVVSLDAFYIDKYEVTLGEYKHFLMATMHRSLPSAVSEYAPTDEHPVVGVSWRDAMAYATWAGKRLPTEAEWEKAARGGLLDKAYPWGNEAPDSSLANYQKMEDTTTPVGEYPPNAFGLYDVAGNVAEWCLDAWDEDFYSPSRKENPFAGRKSRDATLEDFKTIRGLRVVRGGSWGDEPSVLNVAARFKAEASVIATTVGFRCAKDASP